MRVIKRVELPETEVTCDKCKSILGYNANDIRNDIFDCLGELHDSSYVICPICKNHITIAIDGKMV